MDNYVEVFEDGTTLIWKNSFVDDNDEITAIECLNPEYGKECHGDWLYKIKYDKGMREAEVFHNEIGILISKPYSDGIIVIGENGVTKKDNF